MPIIYFYIHIYLEAIIPDAYGVTESCCFCFRRGRRAEVPEDDLDDDDKSFASSIQANEANQDNQDDLEQKLLNNDRKSVKRRQSEARKQFDRSDPIQLKKMTKMFGDFRAVDEMTLSIKNDEIIALLGHNGAGKTTAIYMLTGMLMPSGGDAIIKGNSIRRDTDEVRRSLGLCQQHDVLHDLVSQSRST